MLIRAIKRFIKRAIKNPLNPKGHLNKRDLFRVHNPKSKVSRLLSKKANRKAKIILNWLRSELPKKSKPRNQS